MANIPRIDREGKIFQIPDGDSNTCAIQTLMVVTECSWDLAKHLADMTGRRKGRGTYSHLLIAEWNQQPGVAKLIPVPKAGEWYKETLNQFVAKFPCGVFYVVIQGHALAAITGRIVDTTTLWRFPKAKIKYVWVREDTWQGNSQEVVNRIGPEF